MKLNLITSIITKSEREFYSLIKNCDTNYIEHRLDKMSNLGSIKIDYSNFTQNSVATLRSINQGGYYDGSDDLYLKVVKNAIDNNVKYIDVEYNLNGVTIKNLLDYAHNNNVKVIISYHNIEYTPSYEKLMKLMKKMNNTGADIIKIVCKANNVNDGHTMLNLQHESTTPTISFSMGNIGSFTRPISLLYGAYFMYVSLDEKTAPGQLTANEIRVILSKMKVNYD